VILCLAPWAAGCGFNNNGKAAETKPETVTLTLALPQTHYKDFLRESIKLFEAEHKNLKIEVQPIPDNQWVNTIKTKAFTNETPDIVRIDKSVMLQIGTERFIEMDGSEPWVGRAIPKELESKKLEGRLYGLPAASDSSIGIICNRELFIKHNLEIPKSIDEFWQVCEAFKKAGVTPLYASDRATSSTQIWFSAAAPQLVPDETWGKLLANEIKWSEVPEFERVLTDLAASRRNGYTNADYMMSTYDSSVEAMSGGNLAMCLSGHFFIRDVLAANPGMNLVMSPMVYADRITSIQSQGMFAIFKNSDKVDLAKEFLNWFSQADNMDAFTGGWGYTHLFSDQKSPLPGWLEELERNYLSQGKHVPHVDSQMVGVDFMDFWSYFQQLVGGEITASEALALWDASYSSQMRSRRMPGWE
jgi:ABC-type glycerol-3-phosphate transport system substrate-binding protein